MTISIVDLEALDALAVPDIIGEEPGFVLGVAVAGEMVWNTARGRTINNGGGVPVGTGSSFYVASVAKQITAAAIAVLIQDGQVNLDAAVRDFLPELPAAFDEVVVTDLVHHLSGVRSLDDHPHSRSVGGALSLPHWWRGLGTWDMVELICGVDELAAPAGTVYRYANEGYLLLAALIERAAGVGINDFVTRRIFAPLGMTRSWYRDSPDAPAADTVGHHLLDATLEPDRSEFHFAGDGGLVTTLDDLRGWAGVLCAPYRLGPALATRLVEQGRLRDGRRIHYAWGISVRPHHGRTIHSHGGRFVGNLAKVVLFPADPAVTFICLANRDDIDIDGLVMDAVNRSMPSTLDFDQPDWRSTLRPDGLRWDDPSMAERPT